jgi:hypothetical protein
MFSSQNSQVSNDANYIEDVFSTFLFNDATQTINNGIDLAGKGGLIWYKSREGTSYHRLTDTARGAQYALYSNATNAQQALSEISSFNSNGFGINAWDSGEKIVSWTFRKQPKFFDVVTYSGSNSNQTISHNLGSAPGCIIIKNTTGVAGWAVYHRSLTNPNQYRLFLNTTAAEDNYGGNFIYNVTSTSFDVAGGSGFINSSGSSFVAYLFAHNAGGFGLTGTDNVISCGLCSSGTFENLGYEPQWILLKNPNSSGSGWKIYDNMRGGGLANYVNQNALEPNTSSAESANGQFSVSATGFTFEANAIYIAIRRGPMKVPTDATKVFAPVTSSAADGTQLTSGFPIDMQMLRTRALTNPTYVVDRLRGVGTTTTAVSNPQLRTNLTNAETNTTGVAVNWNNTGFAMPTGFGGVSEIFWNFQRAPGFFDEVCYTGNRVSGSTTQTLTHNLGVVPELMIVKGRSSAYSWFVYSATLGATQNLILQSTAGAASAANPNGIWNETAPTSTQFTVGANNNINGSGTTFVAYLFATCAGVSKCTAFTGNGSSQTINCGFTAGSRFVMIKRTDSTGDWYVWDSARGIVSGNDPHLSLNSTAAEVTTDDTIDTDSTGFIVNQVSATNCNVNGASYIVLAIA